MSNGTTLAEQGLEGGLPETEAILLRARMQCHPTLYRVAEHDEAAGTVTMDWAAAATGRHRRARSHPAHRFVLGSPAPGGGPWRTVTRRLPAGWSFRQRQLDATDAEAYSLSSNYLVQDYFGVNQ